MDLKSLEKREAELISQLEELKSQKEELLSTDSSRVQELLNAILQHPIYNEVNNYFSVNFQVLDHERIECSVLKDGDLKILDYLSTYRLRDFHVYVDRFWRRLSESLFLVRLVDQFQKSGEVVARRSFDEVDLFFVNHQLKDLTSKIIYISDLSSGTKFDIRCEIEWQEFTCKSEEIVTEIDSHDIKFTKSIDSQQTVVNHKIETDVIRTLSLTSDDIDYVRVTELVKKFILGRIKAIQLV